MRWLVTGSAGLLGRDVVAVLGGVGEQVSAATREDLDITDATAVDAAVRGQDLVVNCAGWTAVDAAEADEAAAFAANAVGAGLLARAARRHGARLVHVSTDYVFDGTAREPYPEDHPLAPVSAYGRSKAAGEWAVRAEHPDGHLVLRTAWLYGAGGACFPKTIAALAEERGSVDVVTDQVGQPTWSRDVAELVHRMVVQGVPAGIYHAASAGQASWFQLAQEVVRAVGLDAGIVHPTTTDRSARRAPRPSYSVLGGRALAAAGVAGIGPWRERWARAAEDVLGQRSPSSSSPSR